MVRFEGDGQRRSEWLEADGLGGFASGTVSGVRTRVYHALLLVATLPPSGRMVLVNGFDAEVLVGGKTFAISTQRYVPGIDAPDGTSRLAVFELDLWPCSTFALPGGRLIQEVFVPHGHAAAVVRWRWEGEGTARLRVRPFFSGRDFHGTHHENPAFGFLPQRTLAGQRWHFYPGVPPLVVRGNGAYRHAPQWYRKFLYEEEAIRGLAAVEDLASPGTYEFDLAAPATLIFAAEGLGDALPEISPPLELAETLARRERTRREAFGSSQLRAADAYLVRRGGGKTVIAGYPWFGDWGRDTFIALRGLCLATGRLKEARDILIAWAETVSEGMLPNRFPDNGEAPEYNSVDASLWYVIVVHEWLRRAGELVTAAIRARLLDAVTAILEGYARGTRYGIRCDDDGLLACGVPGVQLTWMDAKIGDWVVTPRIGKPVEVQALWLHALGLAASYDARWAPLAENGRVSFPRRFWNDAQGFLYDVVDVDHQPGTVDASLRPNQVFAAGGLPLPLLNPDQVARVLAVVEEQLWTPMGLRSLAPGEPHYAPHYVGSQLQRDAAYHQGTVWPWLTGAFVEAWVRHRGGTAAAKTEARVKFLVPALARSDLAGLHHVPEIADAEPPHLARGCPFQAWSLGEIVRLEREILANE